MASFQEIQEALLKQRRMKNQLQEQNLLLRRYSFDIGMPQEFVGKISISDFLIGYLVGNGFTSEIELYRKKEESK